MTKEERLNVDQQEILVRRSARRRKTVSARWEEGVMCLAVPSTMSVQEVEQWARTMRARLDSRASKAYSDEELAATARRVSQQVFNGRGEPSSIRWVTNQKMRWGSATLSTGAVRISHLMQGMPGWVIDYVIGHEVAHLIEPRAGHGARFRELEARIPRAKEARAFLDGVVWARRLNTDDVQGASGGEASGCGDELKPPE